MNKEVRSLEFEIRAEETEKEEILENHKNAMLDAVNRRAAARAAKDWAESDKIRDELAAAGWAVKDSKGGQQLSRI